MEQKLKNQGSTKKSKKVKVVHGNINHFEKIDHPNPSSLNERQCQRMFKLLHNCTHLTHGSAGKESACNAGDSGSIPGLGRSLEKGKAAHSSILAWRIPWTTPRVAKCPTGLSDFHFHFTP